MGGAFWRGLDDGVSFVVGDGDGGRTGGPAIPVSRFRAAEHGWAPVVAGGGGRLVHRRTRGELGSRVGPLPVQDLHHGAVAAAPHHVARQPGRFEGSKPVARLVPRKAEAAPHG